MYENDGYDESFLTPIEDIVELTSPNIIEIQLFNNFINKIEGWKTRCKNLHWAAPKKNIHVYLDDFLNVLSDYQDSLAEGYMGILGKMKPNDIYGTPCSCCDAITLINEIRIDTLNFYESIPADSIYKGLSSDCETFIQNINKYTYLFSLTDAI